MTTETRSLYSQLPAIDRLLRDSSFLSLRDTYGHTRVVELLRQMLDEAREVIRGSQTLPAWCENWAQEVDARLTKEALSPCFALEGVIDRQGVIVCGCDTRANLLRLTQPDEAAHALRATRERWLGAVSRLWMTTPDADIAIGRWRSCCAALRERKMPVSLITMRRRCY